MRIHRFATAPELAAGVARRFVAAANAAIGERGVFCVALAGGRTPEQLYLRLRGAPLDWGRVAFYWSDERFVPATDPRSNEALARRTLLDFIPGARVVPMVNAGSAAACAERYEALLPARLDLALLGLGEDGHTASLFPGFPAVHETARSVIVAQAPGDAPLRLTLTVPYLNRARALWFLASGAGKAAALQRLLHGPEDWDLTPAQAVARHAPQVELFVDEAALPVAGSGPRLLPGLESPDLAGDASGERVR